MVIRPSWYIFFKSIICLHISQLCQKIFYIFILGVFRSSFIVLTKRFSYQSVYIVYSCQIASISFWHFVLWMHITWENHFIFLAFRHWIVPRILFILNTIFSYEFLDSQTMKNNSKICILFSRSKSVLPLT